MAAEGDFYTSRRHCVLSRDIRLTGKRNPQLTKLSNQTGKGLNRVYNATIDKNMNREKKNMKKNLNINIVFKKLRIIVQTH